MLAPIPSPQDLLRTQWYHNSLQAWLVAALTATVALLLLLVVRRTLLSRLGALAARTTNNIDDMFVGVLAETRTWVLFAFAIYLGTLPLELPRLENYLHTGAKLVLLWQAALWSAAGVSFWVMHYMRNRTTTHDRASVAMITAMGVGAKVLLWILVALTALKTVFGIEITALITGLGVGGIAVALAVQNILADLLAALAI